MFHIRTGAEKCVAYPILQIGTFIENNTFWGKSANIVSNLFYAYNA